MSEEQNVKKKTNKVVIVLILTVILGGAASFGVFMVHRSMSYLTTDNARVTTDLIGITPNLPGVLERFNIYEGRYVNRQEVLGWVENDEAMRAPVDGLVLHTNARQGQLVSPHEPVAIIADTSRIHIQANIEETDISTLRVGQSVSVTIDTFGSRQFDGYISEIGRITQAELTGAAMFFNTGGTFTRVTHLIPIEISLREDVNLDNFIGVNARVRIPLR